MKQQPPDEMTASQFKAQCLSLMDEVAQHRKAVIITKHGKPVAQLTPVTRKASSLFGLHQGQLTILGDIIAPLDERWEAEQG